MMMINQAPIRVAVTGITGRMGTEIIRCITTQNQKHKLDKKIVLGAAIVREKSTICGMDIGNFIESSVQKVIITDDIERVKEDFDILIDFTHPDITMEYLKFCMVNKKNMIIGTTGFNLNHLNLIRLASKNIGIVYSSNFSIGITIMLKLLKKVSEIIGNIVDIDIIEIHHNKKIDIPSGTALMMKDIITTNIEKKNNIFLGKIPENIKCSDSLNISNLSMPNKEINIHSIRTGDIIGEHTVLFSSIGERLEITHKASNRKIFANGALHAAIWLGKTKIGLFDLNDVLI